MAWVLLANLFLETWTSIQFTVSGFNLNPVETFLLACLDCGLRQRVNLRVKLASENLKTVSLAGFSA